MNCEEIWKAFTNAFLSKNPCKIAEEDYQPLIKMVKQSLPCNKILFWSKTKTLAHDYTKDHKDMFTLENTLLGYMFDNLTWCGDAGKTEMNYKSCPVCSSSAVNVFWKAASKALAETACGVVYVMLSGSIKNAFDPNSVFGSVEVVNLNPNKVRSLQAWVMTDIGGVARDSCSGSSINELESILKQKSIQFTCLDDYK
ncbi:PREDICTED: ADP-ribosyl cyclase 1-like [Chrysochloris asiatica]|uniref:ADP-ribosyl cyclase/cyclic ADP-ribose hydrolase 1 n=1 Tax=Chrysochloris asiatica TaxID=185453 RepID=A0A9B0UBS3_CHRAS|nr:PREDICTED: ADP-ribosyl cyclase 1-like [Chrysochloris asiatica]